MSVADPRDAGTDSEALRRLLAGYPHAALLMTTAGQIAATNERAARLCSDLGQEAAGEFPSVMAEAMTNGAIAVRSLKVPGRESAVSLEVTVVPSAVNGLHLVFARDVTMERNLRNALLESRQRFKDLVEISSDFAWEVGSDGTFAFVSPKGALGFAAAALVGRRPEQLVINADDDGPLPFLTDRPLEETELWLRREDGSIASVVMTSVPVIDEAGRWRGARGICRDVTAEREREAALAGARSREQLLNYIVRTVRDEIEPADMLNAAAAGTARALGAAGSQIFLQRGSGFAAAAAYGETLDDSDPAAWIERAAQAGVVAIASHDRHLLTAATRHRHQVNGAIVLWRTDDRGPWADDERALLQDVANQLGIANEQIANHERILRLSRTDGLTGLLNRRAFYEDELPRRLRRAVIDRNSAALLYVDLDNFKRVNDVLGHQRGDDALLAVRDLLLDNARPGDTVARLGGDEFTVWLDRIPADAVEARVAALLEASQSLASLSGDASMPLGLSIGVALFRPDLTDSQDSLIARADQAMYEVKRAGKGGYRIADHHMAVASEPQE